MKEQIISAVVAAFVSGLITTINDKKTAAENNRFNEKVKWIENVRQTAVEFETSVFEYWYKSLPDNGEKYTQIEKESQLNKIRKQAELLKSYFSMDNNDGPIPEFSLKDSVRRSYYLFKNNDLYSEEIREKEEKEIEARHKNEAVELFLLNKKSNDGKSECLVEFLRQFTLLLSDSGYDVTVHKQKYDAISKYRNDEDSVALTRVETNVLLQHELDVFENAINLYLKLEWDKAKPKRF